MKNNVNVSVIQDADGSNIVMINDIAFKGKRLMNWDDLKEIKCICLGRWE